MSPALVQSARFGLFEGSPLIACGLPSECTRFPRLSELLERANTNGFTASQAPPAASDPPQGVIKPFTTLSETLSTDFTERRFRERRFHTRWRNLLSPFFPYGDFHAVLHSPLLPFGKDSSAIVMPHRLPPKASPRRPPPR